MFYFRKILSTLCIVLAISLANSMDAPKNIKAPSSDEIMEIAKHTPQGTKEHEFYLVLSSIKKAIEKNNLQDAEDKYDKLRQNFLKGVSPDENLVHLVLMSLLTEKIDKFINENKKDKNLAIRELTSIFGIVKYSINQNKWNDIKPHLPSIQKLVIEYIDHFISENKKVTDENVSLLVHFSFTAKGNLENNIKALNETILQLRKGLDMTEKEMNIADKIFGQCLLSSLKIFEYLQDESDAIILDTKSHKKEEMIPEQKKLEKEKLEKERLEKEKKQIQDETVSRDNKVSDDRKEFVKAADTHYKRALRDFGLSDTATYSEAKKQYYKFSRELHPDKNESRDTPERAAKRDAVIKAWDYIQAHFREGVYAGL
ncbi:MAG: J domain-containing protein [Candidatus Paracaedibacter sp.]